jgi:hypothetical protein
MSTFSAAMADGPAIARLRRIKVVFIFPFSISLGPIYAKDD